MVALAKCHLRPFYFIAMLFWTPLKKRTAKGKTLAVSHVILFGLKIQGQAQAWHDGQLVNPLVAHPVEVEDVLPVVHVGCTCHYL